jgi:SAM-dependent methyltransferase
MYHAITEAAQVGASRRPLGPVRTSGVSDERFAGTWPALTNPDWPRLSLQGGKVEHRVREWQSVPVGNRIAGDFDYESNGSGYAMRRRTDPRIASYVHNALGSARTVINVGAGAGSYEPIDREVTPIEPSQSMRNQRPHHLSRAIDAVAEDLPFADGSFDAAMATVTIHQWSDPDQGLRELRRVSRGPVVILTFDGDALDAFWLADYVPELITAERGRYPAISHIQGVLGGVSVVTAVPIPIDCVDGFTEAYYARPESFLDPDVRKSQSAWAFVDSDVIDRSVDSLRRDLESGDWDRRNGALRSQPEFIGSLRLITSTPTTGSA